MRIVAIVVLFIIVVTLLLPHMILFIKRAGASIMSVFAYFVSVMRVRAVEFFDYVLYTVRKTINVVTAAMIGIAGLYLVVKGAAKWGIKGAVLGAILTGVYAGLVGYFIIKPIKEAMDEIKEGFKGELMTVLEMFNPEYFRFFTVARTKEEILKYFKNYIVRGALEGKIWKDFGVVGSQRFIQVNLTDFDKDIEEIIKKESEGIFFINTNCSFDVNESGKIIYYYIPSFLITLNNIDLPDTYKNVLNKTASKAFYFPVGYFKIEDLSGVLFYPIFDTSENNELTYYSMGVNLSSGEDILFEIKIANLDNNNIDLSKVLEKIKYIKSSKILCDDVSGNDIPDCSQIGLEKFYNHPTIKILYPGPIQSTGLYGEEIIRENYWKYIGYMDGVLVMMTCED